jgi:hypothetical protein
MFTERVQLPRFDGITDKFYDVVCLSLYIVRSNVLGGLVHQLHRPQLHQGQDGYDREIRSRYINNHTQTLYHATL